MTDRIALDQFRTAAAVDQREAAFAELVRTHAPWLYNAALRQVRDPAAAEEATQATFIVLAKKAAGLREDTSLTAWLSRVLQLSVLRVKRDHARRTKHETQAAMNRTQEMASDNPADAAAWRELAPLLDDAVATLAKTDREAILLRFYRQLSYAEMAAALAIGEDAARKRVDRAVERLRGTLSRRGLSGIAGAAAVSALLWSNASAVAAPPGLVGTATTLAFATPAAAAAPAVVTAKGVSAALVFGKVKFAAAVIVVGIVALVGEEWVRRGQTPTVPQPELAATSAPAPPATPVGLIGRLKNGITAELIAIAPSLSPNTADANTDAPPRVWWQPDGTPLATPPHAGRLVTAAPSDGRVPVELFLRVTGTGTQTPSFEAVVGGSGSLAVSRSSDPSRRPVVVTSALAAAVPDRPLTLRLNLSTGDWVQDSGSILELPVRLPEPEDRQSVQYQMPVYDNDPRSREKEFRVVGIEAGGRETVANSIARNPVPNSEVVRVVFGFRPENVGRFESFRLESRSRDGWIEFRDVSIHAGTPTKPVVETSDSLQNLADSDRSAMQGNWLAVTYRPGGRTVAPVMPTAVTMVIAGDQMTVSGAGFKDTTTFTLDPSHEPKWIDFIRTDGSRVEGLYEWQGELLRIRLGSRHELIQRGFDAGPGSVPGVLMEFKRAEPAQAQAQLAKPNTAAITAELFAAALRTKLPAAADVLTTEAYRAGHPKAVETLLARIDFTNAKINGVIAEDQRARAVISGFAVNGRPGHLGISLVNENGKWHVRDLDALPTDAARDRFIKALPTRP